MADDDKIEYVIRPKHYESVASAKCSKNHGCGHWNYNARNKSIVKNKT